TADGPGPGWRGLAFALDTAACREGCAVAAKPLPSVTHAGVRRPVEDAVQRPSPLRTRYALRSHIALANGRYRGHQHGLLVKIRSRSPRRCSFEVTPAPASLRGPPHST